MTIKKLFLTFIVAIAVFGLAAGAIAAENKDKVNRSENKGKMTSEAQAVADLSLAGQLSEYARRVKNPTAMLVAAQIMKNTPTQEKKQEKTTEGTGTESGKKSGSLDTPDKLLAEAMAMAKQQGNYAVAALIEKESKLVAKRAAVGGAVRHVDRVEAGKTDVYTITFRGGEQAGVVVIGDGDCDLDLKVYDQGGHLIARDTNDTDRCVATWTPRWTGKFYIKIKNYCSMYADYILAATN